MIGSEGGEEVICLIDGLEVGGYNVVEGGLDVSVGEIVMVVKDELVFDVVRG